MRIYIGKINGYDGLVHLKREPTKGTIAESVVEAITFGEHSSIILDFEEYDGKNMSTIKQCSYASDFDPGTLTGFELTQLHLGICPGRLKKYIKN